MKKNLMIAALIAVTALGVQAQKINSDKLPQAVKSSFSKEYPKATEAKWEKEKADFEVSFNNSGKEISVVYDASGMEKEVETEIQTSQLPALVQTALKGKKIKEAAEIKKNGKTYYEAQVGGKDLYFEASGKAVSTID